MTMCTWFGMTTNTPAPTPGKRIRSSVHHHLIIHPAALNRIVPLTTDPNRQARSWVQIVTKYAPAWH